MSPSLKPYMSPLSLSQIFTKVELDALFRKLPGVLKNLHVNITFIDALSQMFMYVKFLKEILPEKRKINEHETIALRDECYVMALNKFLVKLKDPVNFSTSHLIGNVSIDRALCDLRLM